MEKATNNLKTMVKLAKEAPFSEFYCKHNTTIEILLELQRKRLRERKEFFLPG